MINATVTGRIALWTDVDALQVDDFDTFSMKVNDDGCMLIKVAGYKIQMRGD